MTDTRNFNPRRCMSCGIGTVDLLAKPGRMTYFMELRDVAIPHDFSIPTCDQCNEEYIDFEIAAALDEIGNKEWQRRRRLPKQPMNNILQLVEFDIYEIHEAPWNKRDWHGKIQSIDGIASTAEIPDDPSIVQRILAWGGSPETDWDGRCGGVALLTDGRFVGWESGWGPTGSGFSFDAYGGDADVFVAMSALSVFLAIGENTRETMKFASAEYERPLVEVLYDAWLEGQNLVQLCTIAKMSGELGDLVEYRIRELIQNWSFVVGAANV